MFNSPYTVSAKLENNSKNVYFTTVKPIKSHFCSKYYLEAVAIFFLGLKIGTVQQCCDAIDHLKRIIKQKASTLNKKSNRRLPRLVLISLSIQMEHYIDISFSDFSSEETLL